MKGIIYTVLSAFLIPCHLHAQDVWKEGTRWEVECYADEPGSDLIELTFELSGHTEIDGMDYLNLIDLNKGVIGYIRTERGDTVVFARYALEGNPKEFLLYDFGTFEPDTYFKYTTWESIAWEGNHPSYVLATDTINAEGLTYYHDIITDGDILPCWNEVLFKVGCLDGPMDYVYTPTSPDDINPFGDKPKRRHISHTVLKLTNCSVEISTDGIITVKMNDTPKEFCYDLQGRRISSPPEKGLYIRKGKKYVR